MDLLDTPAEEAFDRLTRLAARSLGAPIALMTLVNENRQFFKSQCGLPEPWASRRETPLSHSFCQHVVALGEPLIIEDAREHPLVRENLAIPDLGVVAYAGIPLRSRDGEALGAFCAIDHHPRRWSQEEIEILSDLAATAADEIGWRAAREGESRFRALAETASEAILTMDADSVMLSANPAAERIFGYTAPELVGQPLSILVPERFRAAHAAGVSRYLQTGRRNIPWKGIELPGLTQAGEEIALEISFGDYVHEGKRVFTGFVRDIRERKRAEEEREFLGEASRALASSLDYETTLRRVAHLAVPAHADFCLIDIVDVDGEIRRVATAHRDPQKEELYQEIQRRYPPDPDRSPLAGALRTGEAFLLPEVTEEWLDAIARNEEHRRLIRDELGTRSLMTVPLSARGQTLGIVTYGSTRDSGRRYGPRDLELAEELASRAAIAVDHARLFQQTEDAREHLERQAMELEYQMEELQNQATHLEESQAELEMANDDLQRMNAELGAAEAHYRRLVETSPYGVFVMDAQGEFTEMNAAGERILGRPADETLGRHFAEMIVPEDLGVAGDAFVRVISGQERHLEVELCVQRPSGERCLVNVVITGIRENGEITGIHGVSRDITEERRTHESLQESETSYRSLFDSLTELVYIQDLEGRFLNVNEAVLRRYGYAREEIVGRTPDLLVDRERTDIAAVQDHFRRASGGEPQVFEFWARTREGESFPKEVSLTRGRYFGEDVVIAVARDISERKAAEEQRRESRRHEERIRAVEQERGRLSALFEQAPAFIALHRGPDHVFDVINGRYQELIGHRDVLGRPIREVLPELEGQGYFELLDRVYTTGEVQVGNGSRVVLQREEGAEPEELYVNFVYQPFVGPAGTVTGIFVHGVDVTELARARQEAEAANRAKSEFLSRMSHELRTPLNAILGFGQLLELEVEAEEDQESVDQILRAGKHLLSLIDEVLDIARIEAGQMSLSLEPVSVRSVLQESVDLVRLTAAKQGITLRAQDALASEHFVGTDQQRLKQVLLNLLSNAIKYNRPEGTVTLACEQVGEDRMRLVVRDTGYGIPADKLERLFTPFDRLGADQSAVEGTGLGLALSKGLVEAMGGKLGVESVEGEGSRFWVELPIVPRPILPESAPAERPEVETPSDAASATRTVLFVEDNLANVRLMERIFRRRPQVRLLTAMQGSLGLELAREHRPDLILLDLNLPDLSGEKVLLQLRQDPALREIPVVMISGDAIPSQVQRMLGLGAQSYITKPFDVHELLRSVDESLLREER